jgi:CheY-like chemotaxis protein
MLLPVATTAAGLSALGECPWSGAASLELKKTEIPSTAAGQASCRYTFDQWLNALKAPTVGTVCVPEYRDREHAGARLIAIVDDEAKWGEATESLLKSVGYRVLTFASAEQFLLSPLRHKVRALVLDVKLPGMNGLELQQCLVAEGDRLPTIFITAQDDLHGRLYRQAMRSGALTVLSKPFNDYDLLRILAPVMEGRRSSA